MNTTFHKIGRVKSASNDIYIIFSDKSGRLYIHHDEEQFYTEKYAGRHQIHRLVSNTVFLTDRAIIINFEKEDGEVVLEAIYQVCTLKADPSLVKLMRIFEKKKMSGDFDVFKDCERIARREELSDFGKKVIPNDIDPPKYYLVEAVSNYFHGYPQEGNKIFLQMIVHTETGWLVEHQELTSELFLFSQLPEVKKLVVAKKLTFD